MEHDGPGDRSPRPDPRAEACALIRHHLDLGAPWDACDLYRERVVHDPGNAELLYCGALAHARAGATEHAHELLDAAERASPAAALVPEILSLRGRLWKDRLHRLAPGTQEATTAALRARDEYRRAYALSRSAYPGVNAATLSMLLGDRADAQALAREVLARLDAQTAAATHWDHATRGEALLLLDRVETASVSYRSAQALVPGNAGIVATMRRQVSLIATVMGAARGVLSAIPAADVLAFVGHMIDAPEAREPRFPAALEPSVAAAIRARLAGLTSPIAYTSAACGADIAFIEAAEDSGAEVNVVLPFHRDDFAHTSVAVGGADWVARFERALSRAHRVIMATEEGHLGDDVLYEYAATMLEGLAVLRATQLETAPTLLAVIDASSEGRLGGARASLERWKRNGGALDVIDLRALREEDATVLRTGKAPRALASRTATGARMPLPPRVAAPSPPRASRPERGLKTMLFADFAGYSRLHDAFAPLFQQQFLTIGAEQVAASATKPLDVKTWGDAIYGVFATPREGADFALGLLARMLAVDWTAAGLPDTSQMRIALHAGPVFETFDPIMGRRGYFGANVTRAARIEPITPPGMVYVSEAFASVLVASGERGYALEYIGMLPLAKEYGASRIYRLDRRCCANRS
jgi:tetratricopeptide (TPR) repeat protein